MSCFKENKFLICQSCKQHFSLLNENFPGDLFSLLLQNDIRQIYWLCKSCNIPREGMLKDTDKINSRVTTLEAIVSDIQSSLSKIGHDDKNIREKEKLKRRFQAVLNKLTPQKFETLLIQHKGFSIDTEEKLNVVIDSIFEKAVDDPKLAVLYANLCNNLALIKVPLAYGGQVNFPKFVLTKCQNKFEQDWCDELKHVENIEDSQPNKKLEFNLEEQKIRHRQLTILRFIGELFKVCMPIEPVMHICIKQLLSQGDEKSLECLCELFKSVGKELDEANSSKSQDHSPVDMYFAQMKTLVDKRSTSSIVRFMLQDVIDLRKDWMPINDKNMCKTINQTYNEGESCKTIDEIKINLTILLWNNEANETIYDWIDANVSENGEPTFIRALVTAVHENVILGATCELAKTTLRERTALLDHCINRNEKLELQALYALQALMNVLGHPTGLLKSIFEILYTHKVITGDTVRAWMSSTDTNESEGRKKSLESIDGFTQWIYLLSMA